MFPSAYIFFLRPISFHKTSRLINDNMQNIIVYLILVAVGTWSNYLGELSIRSNWYLFLISPVIGCCNVWIEYLVVGISFVVNGKKWPKLKPTSVYSGKWSWCGFVLIFIAASLEEIVFRQVMIQGIFKQWQLSIWIGVLISSLLYAINHVYFGRFTVIQKFISGLFFSLLFVWSGNNILIPILSHCAQNIYLYCYTMRLQQLDTQLIAK